jgi:hypothetical protein
MDVGVGNGFCSDVGRLCPVGDVSSAGRVPAEKEQALKRKVKATNKIGLILMIFPLIKICFPITITRSR